MTCGHAAVIGDSSASVRHGSVSRASSSISVPDAPAFVSRVIAACVPLPGRADFASVFGRSRPCACAQERLERIAEDHGGRLETHTAEIERLKVITALASAARGTQWKSVSAYKSEFGVFIPPPMERKSPRGVVKGGCQRTVPSRRPLCNGPLGDASGGDMIDDPGHDHHPPGAARGGHDHDFSVQCDPRRDGLARLPPMYPRRWPPPGPPWRRPSPHGPAAKGVADAWCSRARGRSGTPWGAPRCCRPCG